MLSRLSPHCTRVAGQGSPFHQCIRRSLPKESRTVAAQRAFTTARWLRSQTPKFWASMPDDCSEVHWNQVAKLSHERSPHSRKEMEFQMSIIQFLEAKKELLDEKWGFKALLELGPTRAWLGRISYLYENTYETGDRMLDYTSSGFVLPSNIKYTDWNSHELRHWRRNFLVVYIVAGSWILLNALWTVKLSIQHGRLFTPWELPSFPLPFPLNVAWGQFKWLRSRWRGDHTDSLMDQYATPTPPDLEQSA